jgi:RNA polymerase sigma factor (sigma-70 family)
MDGLAPDEVAECVRKFLAGSPDAFEPLYRAHRDRLYRVACARLGEGPDAEDCVQEAFVRAARYLKSYDPARPFWGWLLRILTNVASDRARARWADRLLADDEIVRVEAPPAGASDAERLRQVAAADERAARVRAVLAELPEDQRTRVMLFYRDGVPHAEIARVMGDPSEEASRQRLKRIRESLRRRLEPGMMEGLA